MIELEINDRRRRVEPTSVKELRELIDADLPAGHLIEQLSVDGRALDVEELEMLELGGLASVAIRSSSPQQLARGSLAETIDWISRICGVLENVSSKYRTGSEREGTRVLVDVIDALQVLVGLLSGIRRWIDVPDAHRPRFAREWGDIESDLHREIEALHAELQAGDPVPLADRTETGLPGVLRRFAVLLEQIQR